MEKQVTVTYLGQCGFLMECDGVRIVTDPYLSDYVDRNCWSAETPWERLYPAPVTLAELKPDGVVISHAHGDHMDPYTLTAYAEAGGTAAVAVPAPVAAQAEEYGLRNVIHARAGKAFEVCGVKITPVPCAHTQLHIDEEGRFFELSYLIDFGCGNLIFFGGDMSLYDGLPEKLAAVKPALLLLPVNGRDADRTGRNIIGNINETEAAELAAGLKIPYVPMHHDLYAINRCPEGAAEKEAERAGACICPLKLMESLALSGGTVTVV